MSQDRRPAKMAMIDPNRGRRAGAAADDGDDDGGGGGADARADQAAQDEQAPPRTRAAMALFLVGSLSGAGAVVMWWR